MKAIDLMTVALLIGCQSPDVEDRDASVPAKDAVFPADSTVGGSGPVDAQVPDAAADAFLPALDMGPGCVAPTAGQCPPDVEEVLLGRELTRAGCFAREEEIVACLYFVGGTAGESCTKRTADGAIFRVGTETCRPEGWEACTPEEFESFASEERELCP